VPEAARVMDRHAVKRLPVVDGDGRLLGIVSRSDLLKVFLRTDEDIREEIVRDVFMHVLWVEPDQVDVQVRQGVVVLTGKLEMKSGIAIAERLTRGVDGVVNVVCELTYATDDPELHRLGPFPRF
jgi:CBS domain-containing protein